MQFVVHPIISADASKLFLRNFFVKNLQYVHSKLLESLNAFDIFFSRRQCLNKDDQPAVFKNLWDVTALCLDKNKTWVESLFVLQFWIKEEPMKIKLKNLFFISELS